MDDLELLKWRDARTLATDDRALAEEFAARAADVRSQVSFLLSGGLTEGAVAALAALAEEDMVDFCIMVDLASGVDISGVAPLDAETRVHLSEFLDEEPWRSLATDNDITIARSRTLPQSTRRPTCSTPIAGGVGDLMDRVDREGTAPSASRDALARPSVRSHSPRARDRQCWRPIGRHRSAIVSARRWCRTPPSS
jgi:hypothetical protein